MLHKSKLLVFLGSLIIVLYGASAAFYGKVVAKEDAYREIAVFMEVLSRVEEDYVEPPDMDKVEQGAMQGLMSALDPYSSFLPRERYDAVQKHNSVSRAGSGMVISRRADVVSIVSCDPGGPGDQMGIRPGDYLVSVDGKQVEDLSILEVESILRGDPGSKVTVEIFRNSLSEPLKLELTRALPSQVVVASSVLNRNVGLLTVGSLEGSSTEQISKRLNKLIDEGIERIVLDLRNCAEGSPSDGAKLVSFFLDNGTIYYSRNRSGEKVDVVEADPAEFVTDIPLVVLINSSTAGAAEIVAGALKDRGRATVVGEKSFGLGSTQKTIELKSGDVLVLSTAKFCTPGGKVIQDETIRDAGVEPDIQVPDSETRQDLAVESYYDNQDETLKYNQLRQKIDRIQLEKALEILNEEKMPVEEAA